MLKSGCFDPAGYIASEPKRLSGSSRVLILRCSQGMGSDRTRSYRSPVVPSWHEVTQSVVLRLAPWEPCLQSGVAISCSCDAAGRR